MKQIGSEPKDRTINLQCFVNEVTGPASSAPVIKTNFAIGIPTRISDPGAKIERSTGHGSSCALRGTLPSCDFIRELNAETLIGIDTENPFMARFGGCEVLLIGVAVPIADYNARPTAFGNLACS